MIMGNGSEVEAIPQVCLSCEGFGTDPWGEFQCKIPPGVKGNCD
jgi:hypothetical protein